MSKAGDRTLKTALRKVIKDKSGRLHPSRKMLAILLLGVLEGHEWDALIQEQYGPPSRLRNIEEGGDYTADKDNKEAQDLLKQAYERISGGDNADTAAGS